MSLSSQINVRPRMGTLTGVQGRDFTSAGRQVCSGPGVTSAAFARADAEKCPILGFGKAVCGKRPARGAALHTGRFQSSGPVSKPADHFKKNYHLTE